MTVSMSYNVRRSPCVAAAAAVAACDCARDAPAAAAAAAAAVATDASTPQDVDARQPKPTVCSMG